MKTPTDNVVISTQSEEYVVLRVLDFLRSEKYRVLREVPSMGLSIDLVARKGRWLTCIEVKLSDWRRGLRQCRAHRLVADYIVLAIASSSVSPDLLSEANIAGVGVIHFDRARDICTWAAKPKPIREVWRPQRRQLSSAIRELDYGY